MFHVKLGSIILHQAFDAFTKPSRYQFSYFYELWITLEMFHVKLGSIILHQAFDAFTKPSRCHFSYFYELWITFEMFHVEQCRLHHNGSNLGHFFLGESVSLRSNACESICECFTWNICP